MWWPPPKLTHSTPAQLRREPLLEHRQGALERVGAQLTQRVEVEPAEPVHQLGAELPARHAEPRAGRGRVVERHLHLGVLRVDPHAGAHAGRPHQRAEPLPLRERVHHHVVGDGEDLAQLLLGEGRRVDVDLLVHLVAPEPGLGQRAGRDPAQVLADDREQAPHREALEREQHLAAGARLHVGQDGQVAAERAEVDDVGRRVDAGHVDVERTRGRRLVDDPVGTHRPAWCSATCHGSP